MRRQTRLNILLSGGFILSGLLLSHQAQAREWLLAQAQPQKQQPQPTQTQPNPPQPQSKLSAPSVPLPRLGVPAVQEPAPPKQSTSNRARHRDPFYRYSTSAEQETPERINGRVRRIPIPPVPMPDEMRRPTDLDLQKKIPRVPNSFASPLTGIMAQVMVNPICSISASPRDCAVRPYQGELKIMTIAGDRQFRASTNYQGQIQLRLPPGLYVIQPTSPDFPTTNRQTVNVIDGMMRSMQLSFQGYAKPQPLPPAPLSAQPQPGADQAIQPVQQPLQSPSLGWQPSVISQPLYPPIGQ